MVLKRQREVEGVELLWKSGCSAESRDSALHGVYHRVLLARKKEA